MRLTKKQREELKQKYGGRCAYCGCELPKRWHADHIEPVKRLGGKVNFPERHYMDNLNPSCSSCNIQKHSETLENFRWNIENFINSLNSYHNQYKFAKKFGLVQETGKKVVFYFEQFEQNSKEN